MMTRCSPPMFVQNVCLGYLEKAEIYLKAQILVSSGISVVAFASVYSEKIRLKKLMNMIIIIIIMNLSQETTFFGGRQKSTPL